MKRWGCGIGCARPRPVRRPSRAVAPACQRPSAAATRRNRDDSYLPLAPLEAPYYRSAVTNTDKLIRQVNAAKALGVTTATLAYHIGHGNLDTVLVDGVPHVTRASLDRLLTKRAAIRALNVR